MNKKMIYATMFIIAFGFLSQGVHAAISHELVPSSRVILRVNPGMSLDDIVRKIYPQEITLWPEIKQKLIEINPYSFHPESENLVPGARLKLVDIKRFQVVETTKKRRVGYIASQDGQTAVIDLEGSSQTLQINSEVYEGDRISTSPGARVAITMDDGAEIYLKEDSVIKISEYVITEGFDEKSSSVLELLRGGLRTITGLIGDSSTSNYQLQTGLATIGIRGTEYVIKLCKLDDCNQTASRNDPDAKLHAVVLAGAITLTTDDDVQILMAIGEYGTASAETMEVLEETEVPTGFLDTVEANRFNVTIPQSLEKEADNSTSVWSWVLGILLIGIGI